MTKPDVYALRGADINDQCPSCGSWIERDKCPMGCPVTRCPECRGIHLGAHVCVVSA